MKNFTFRGRKKFFWGTQGGQSGPISKNRKILIQNDGLNPQPKFQNSSWIRKCLKIGDFWGGFRPPHRGWGVQFQKIEKSLIQNGSQNLQFQHSKTTNGVILWIHFGNYDSRTNFWKNTTAICSRDRQHWGTIEVPLNPLGPSQH